MTGELVEAKAADRVRYVEIRWGPALHTRRGLPLAEGIAAVCRGAAEAAERTGVVVRLICTALRSHDPALNVELAETAARFRGRGLVGWDLAGPEADHPDPPSSPRAFEAARAGGLRITLHAGEWGGAAQVRRALALDPERIAHGPGAIDDPGARGRADRARASPSTSARRATSRPGSCRRWPTIRSPASRARACPVTLSTDDLHRVRRQPVRGVRPGVPTQIGLTLPELWAIDRRALDVAFADEATLIPLRTEFDRWAAGIPELATASGPGARPAAPR